MNGVLLRVADLAREPEFHLDELLAVLAQVQDGYSTERAEVWSGETKEPGWELEAGGYVIGVDPDYRCGWDEMGNGKVLTALLKRLSESGGRCTLRTVWQPGKDHRGQPCRYTTWEAAVKLGREVNYLGSFESSSERLGCKGMGKSDAPGVATLLAYLRAWGVLE